VTNSETHQQHLEPATEQSRVSPFLLEFFLVQGAGFRCMAYRDQDGKWHSAFDHQELPGVICVLE
jgi:hypothetical protein